MIWLDRAGLLLELSAFFLAAPEVLGKRKLSMIHQAMNRSVALLAGVPIALRILLVLSAGAFRFVLREGGSVDAGFFVAGTTLLLAGGSYLWIGRPALSRLATNLESREPMRRHFLLTAASCYVIGFACQFAATFR